jgi:hypothetical protein
MYMETLCMAILNKQKMTFFFSFLQNERTAGKNWSCLGGLVIVGVGRRWGKGIGYTANTEYTCMYMEK